MSLYQQQREQVKEKILATSLAVFREKGYDEATIEEITKRVGIAKGTFYNFFSSKNEILMAWAVEKFQTFDFSIAFNPEKTAEENLYSFTGVLAQAIQEERSLFVSFLKEVLTLQGDPKIERQFNLHAIYGAILANSSDYGTVSRSLLGAKIEVLNSALFMGMINALGTAFTADELEKHLNQLVQVCLYGMLGNKEGEAK